MKNLSDFEKIMQVLKAKGLSVAKAEGLAGIGATTISKMKQRKNGEGSLHEDNLQKFLRTFHVKRAWWDTNEGEMFEQEAASNSEPIKTMPLDVWHRLERNFNNFERNSELFEKVLAKEDSEKSQLLEIIRNLTSGQIQSHKMK